jgi:hypothetical protein
MLCYVFSKSNNKRKEQLDWIYLAIDMRHILPKVIRVIQSCNMTRFEGNYGASAGVSGLFMRF